MSKIIPLEQVEQLASDLHSQSKKIVLTGGCFDLLHIGHITFLENAKKEGGILVVLLESDESIRQNKGAKRPIHTLQQRAHMVASLSFVDYVIPLPRIFTNEDYDTVVKLLQPAIIAATEEDPGLSHKKRQAHMVGGEVIFVNKFLPSVSTTHIIQTLLKEEM